MPFKEAPRVAVIGAGPAGLVTAKTLLANGWGRSDVVVFEASSVVGGTFVNKKCEFQLRKNCTSECPSSMQRLPLT